MTKEIPVHARQTQTLPEKGTSKTVANKGRAAELTVLFLKTPEMQECKTTAGTILNQLDEGDKVSIQIKLARALGVQKTKVFGQGQIGLSDA